MPKKAKWNELPCLTCKEPCSVDAAKCPHCQTVFTPGEIESRKQQQSQSTKLGFGCLGVLVLTVAWCSVPESIPDDPQSGAKGDAVAYYRKIISEVAMCDLAGRGLAKAAKTPNAVAMYNAANEVESSCLEVPSKIRGIEVPKSVGKIAYDELKRTRDICENTYLNRWSAARSIKSTLDGESKVSDLAEMERASTAIGSGTILCSAGLVSVATKLGATVDELGVGGK